MSALVCRAHPQVQAENLTNIQDVAARRLHASRPVLDTELLSRPEAERREAQICRQTGLCGLGLAGYARRVTAAMRPVQGWDRRTLVNVQRVFRSRRLTTAELSHLIGFMRDADQVSAFRNTARILFTRAELFYYDYVPFQGAVQCFRRSGDAG